MIQTETEKNACAMKDAKETQHRTGSRYKARAVQRFCAALLFALILPFYAVCAEEDVAVSDAAQGARVIDRITDPASEPEFAFAEDANLLEIVFPQILNTDAILLRCGDEAVLMDCASAQQASRVTALLEQLGITRLDAVINSHPHYDHLQGLDILASVVEIGALRICFPEDYNKHMVTALEVAKQHGIPVETYGDEDVMSLGGATLTAWCKGDESWNCNERSAVLKVNFGRATALLTGDMMLKTQLRLLEAIPSEELDIDILKYPHHGLHKLNDDFYNALSPAFAVITNNGTKSREGRRYLGYKHIPYALTVPGYVSLTTDGEVWLIERVTPEQPADGSAGSDASEAE